MLIAFVVNLEQSLTFEQPSYVIFEEVRLDNFALRVCINIAPTLTSERTVRISTTSGTATGNIFSPLGISLIS